MKKGILFLAGFTLAAAFSNASLLAAVGTGVLVAALWDLL